MSNIELINEFNGLLGVQGYIGYYKGIKVLYKTYSNQIIELINLNLINELFKNLSVIKKYNYSFDTFKDNSKILQNYLEKVYKKQFFNKV